MGEPWTVYVEEEGVRRGTFRYVFDTTPNVGATMTFLVPPVESVHSTEFTIMYVIPESRIVVLCAAQ
jgi:hypothetical protein